jgi:hypothetical protein
METLGVSASRFAGYADTAKKALLRLNDVLASPTLQLLGIVALAFLLRVIDVTQPLTDTFAWREASTAMMADNLPRNGWNPLWPEVSWTGDQPGYQGREFQSLTIFAALLDLLFGWADWHGRLVAALFGTLTTLSIYHITVRVFGQREALWAALVYATLPGAIIIDRSYLPDPAMLALLTAGVWLFLSGMKTLGNAELIGAWLLLTAAVLAKLPALCVAPALAYVFFIERHRIGVRRWAAISIAIAIATVAITAYYAWAYYLGHTQPPFHVAGDGWVWHVNIGFGEFWKRNFYIPSLVGLTYRWFTTPAFILLALLGLLTPISAEARYRWFFHLPLLGILVIVLLAAQWVSNNPWNLHIANLTVAGFAGRGLAIAFQHLSRPRGIPTIPIAVVTMFFVGNTYYPVTSMAEPYARVDRELGLALNRVSAPGELVVVSGTQAGMPTAIYYSRRRGFVFPSPEMDDNDWVRYGPGEARVASEGLRDLVNRGARWFGIIKAAYDLSEPPQMFVDEYASLITELRRDAVVVFEDDQMVVFDLRPLRKARATPAGGDDVPSPPG